MPVHGEIIQLESLLPHYCSTFGIAFMWSSTSLLLFQPVEMNFLLFAVQNILINIQNKNICMQKYKENKIYVFQIQR